MTEDQEELFVEFGRIRHFPWRDTILFAQGKGGTGSIVHDTVDGHLRGLPSPLWHCHYVKGKVSAC